MGGSILLVVELPFLLVSGYFGWIFSIPALFVVACGVLLYQKRSNRRVLEVLIISLSLVAGIPFYAILVEPVFNIYSIWAIFALAGVIVTIMGARQAIREKQTAPAQRNSNAPL
jgi:hypothetical protein